MGLAQLHRWARIAAAPPGGQLWQWAWREGENHWGLRNLPACTKKFRRRVRPTRACSFLRAAGACRAVCGIRRGPRHALAWRRGRLLCRMAARRRCRAARGRGTSTLRSRLPAAECSRTSCPAYARCAPTARRPFAPPLCSGGTGGSVPSPGPAASGRPSNDGPAGRNRGECSRPRASAVPDAAVCGATARFDGACRAQWMRPGAFSGKGRRCYPAAPARPPAAAASRTRAAASSSV